MSLSWIQILTVRFFKSGDKCTGVFAMNGNGIFEDGFVKDIVIVNSETCFALQFAG